jgi:hypothetical protein
MQTPEKVPFGTTTTAAAVTAQKTINKTAAPRIFPPLHAPCHAKLQNQQQQL